MSASDDMQIAQFKALVVEEWSAAETIQAWHKWHHKIVPQLADMTEAIVQEAQLRPGMTVLDLASGTGDPALTLARLVGPTGRIIATDLSQGMLDIAEANARQESFANITFQQADAELLPFPDASFDAVVSRIGVMYFVDVQRALAEIRRVLKPDGRVVLTAWGPLEQNRYAATMLTPFVTRADVPPPPPGAPQPLRFAQPDTLAAELRAAGFGQVREETRLIMSRWPGPPEEFWQHFYDIAVPFRPVFDGLAADERAAAIGEVIAGLGEYYDGERVNIPTSIVIASAIRYD